MPEGPRVRRPARDQAVLQSEMGALDPAFRLAGIGTQNFDVELVQRPAEPGHSIASRHAGPRHPKDAMLVAIEGNRLAVRLDRLPGRLEIGQGALARHELQEHQPAGRVVDEHEQRHLRAAILEPPMFAAIDLHQFADTVAPVAGPVDGLGRGLALDPKALGNHPLAQGLARDRQRMQLGRLLRCEGRPEIAIALAEDGHGSDPHGVRKPPVADHQRASISVTCWRRRASWISLRRRCRRRLALSSAVTGK